MRSTTGQHFLALDHVRALAALLVFEWHFIHGMQGYPVPFASQAWWNPLVLFDEGHVGVALFMTLSGYLFAKLLDGKSVRYLPFLWNRALRLLPLLGLVILVRAGNVAFSQNSWLAGLDYLTSMVRGFWLPIWPNGGWSITAEMHFYLVLPLLLGLRHKHPLWLLAIPGLALLLRALVHTQTGEIQSLAYPTLLGRIDQFTLGIVAFHIRASLRGRQEVAFGLLIGLVVTYGWFAAHGGFYRQPSYPSPSPIWVVLSTLEGAAFGGLIAWYDTFHDGRSSWLGRWCGRMGEYSYSVYLLHFFLVFAIADWLHRSWLDLSNFYIAVAVGLIAYLAMLPLGYCSMRFLEGPILKWRLPYAVPRDAAPSR